VAAYTAQSADAVGLAQGRACKMLSIKVE